MARDKARPRLTLGALAEAARVSKATASMVLNGRPGISTDTRQRVLAMAKELDYQPNRAAREVASGVATTLGIVLSPTQSEHELPNYYVAELLAGAEEEATARGYQLRVTVWQPEARRPPEDTGLAGMLYLGGSFDPAILTQTQLPSVLVGTFFPQWPFDAVLADNSRGAYLAVVHLMEVGGRRVAFVNGPPTTRTSELKMLGYREAIAEHGLVIDPALVRAGDFSVESGYSAVQDLLKHNAKPPDSLFVADDPMAIGAIHALQDEGLSVPDQVTVVGYGDSPAGSVLRPAMSTVRVFQRRMGSLGARQLIERLGGRETGSIRILVEPKLVVRESSQPTNRVLER
jgi:LacI family transcriptional regulator